MKKSEKFPKVKLWSIFTTSLELILSEIPKKASARPARRGGQKNPSAAAAAAIPFPQTPFPRHSRLRFRSPRLMAGLAFKKHSKKIAIQKKL